MIHLSTDPHFSSVVPSENLSSLCPQYPPSACVLIGSHFSHAGNCNVYANVERISRSPHCQKTWQALIFSTCLPLAKSIQGLRGPYFSWDLWPFLSGLLCFCSHSQIQQCFRSPLHSLSGSPPGSFSLIFSESDKTPMPRWGNLVALSDWNLTDSSSLLKRPS